MEARRSYVCAGRTVATVWTLAAFFFFAANVYAAAYRTTNFTVVAPTPRLAKAIGDTAEKCRRELALEWLGKELPKWPKPCPIKARVSPTLGAGGATSFVFDRGRVFGWQMDIQGSAERVLDSVVPHEVTHTIFASHFRQPLPRWADEGACTTVEHRSEIDKQERMLLEFLQTRRGIPFNDMFAMKEYPKDVLPLYAQGHSLAKYLIAKRGKRAFMAFVEDGLRDDNWPRAIETNYSYPHLLALQKSWLAWVRKGQPEIQSRGDAVLVAADEPVVRGQDPQAAQESVATDPNPVIPTPPSVSRTAAARSPYARLRESSLNATVRRKAIKK